MKKAEQIKLAVALVILAIAGAIMYFTMYAGKTATPPPVADAGNESAAPNDSRERDVPRGGPRMAPGASDDGTPPAEKPEEEEGG
ncbi:MAG: hypothetical protein JNM07_06340 [Phycisphaerae bacterium]|nr:hypothetical protein [Phycisphaerae bacterium]